jgi:hypothetical protein
MTVIAGIIPGISVRRNHSGDGSYERRKRLRFFHFKELKNEGDRASRADCASLDSPPPGPPKMTTPTPGHTRLRLYTRVGSLRIPKWRRRPTSNVMQNQARRLAQANHTHTQRNARRRVRTAPVRERKECPRDLRFDAECGLRPTRKRVTRSKPSRRVEFEARGHAHSTGERGMKPCHS